MSPARGAPGLVEFVLEGDVDEFFCWLDEQSDQVDDLERAARRAAVVSGAALMMRARAAIVSGAGACLALLMYTGSTHLNFSKTPPTPSLGVDYDQGANP